jgi:hypothetical protein
MKISSHSLCECEALDALRHVYLYSSFLDPKYIKSLNLEAIWNFSKAVGLPELVSDFGAQKA